MSEPTKKERSLGEEPASKRLGHLLRTVRGRDSIEAMAGRLGAKPSTLGRYERGENLPDTGFLAKFAEVCDVNLADLLALTLEASGVEAAAAIDRLRQDLLSEQAVDALRRHIAGLGERPQPYVNEPSTNINEPVERPETEGGIVAGDVYVSIQKELLEAPDLAPLVLEYIKVMKAGRRDAAPGPRQAG